MIRLICLAGSAVVLLLFAIWNLYSAAYRHDPYSEVKVKSPRQQGKNIAVRNANEYKPGWQAEIHEKNLFSPARTYKEPRPVAPVNLPPVEPVKRPEIVLKGVILDSFGEYVAFIEIDKGKAIPMRKGDKADNIELIDLSGRKAVLKWNTETMNLTLDKIKTIDNPRAAK